MKVSYSINLNDNNRNKFTTLLKDCLVSKYHCEAIEVNKWLKFEEDLENSEPFNQLDNTVLETRAKDKLLHIGDRGSDIYLDLSDKDEVVVTAEGFRCSLCCSYTTNLWMFIKEIVEGDDFDNYQLAYETLRKDVSPFESHLKMTKEVLLELMRDVDDICTLGNLNLYLPYTNNNTQYALLEVANRYHYGNLKHILGEGKEVKEPNTVEDVRNLVAQLDEYTQSQITTLCGDFINQRKYMLLRPICTYISDNIGNYNLGELSMYDLEILLKAILDGTDETVEYTLSTFNLKEEENMW